MRNLVSLVAFTTLLAFFLSALPSLAIENQYTEDFSTTQYQDVSNTTAWWDTVAGELKLPLYVPTLVGTLDTPGRAWGVTFSGDHAFVADHSSGLQVIDITDPTNPTLAGTCDTPGLAWEVSVAGNYAYVADGAYGLQVIDISDPSSPTLSGNCDTPVHARGVVLSGDHAFVADDFSSIQVIDISDPVNPVLVGSCNTPDYVIRLSASGDHLFVANYLAGLQVVDISDPANPAISGTCDTPGNAYDITISGDHVFVADENSGLQVVDVSDPTNPTLIGSCDTPDWAYGVTVSGDRAYVADYSSGLQVIDISDPSNPVLVGTCDTPDAAWEVEVSGDYAFLADDNSGFQVIRIADPMLPVRAAGDVDLSGETSEPVFAGDYAYVITNAASGVGVIDISDPTSPALVGSFVTPGALRDIAVDGNHLYLADSNSGFRVLDISDPSNPFSAGTLSMSGWAKYVVLQGNYAYVGCDYTSQSFNVVDISDPANPTLAGYLSHGSGIVQVAVEGNYAFFGVNDLYSVDISDPTTPTLVGSCSTPGNVSGITIDGDYAYVVDDFVGLHAIDISDPAIPSIAGTCAISTVVGNVAVSGNFAYIGAPGSSGLSIVDISDPAIPVLLDTYFPPSRTYWPAISGDYLYLGDLTGLHVVEVFQGRFNVAGNIGQSLALDDSEEPILWAKLTTTQVNSVDWELSADGGSAWASVPPDDSWHQFATPGTDLLWRSTHSNTVPGLNPACDDLQIKWLYDFGAVETIVDLPNDQGRQVRISWAKSGNDYLGSSTPITQYAVYRKIDETLPMAEATARQEPEVQMYPPGDWAFVASVPACCEDEYAVIAPTVVDSTIAEGMYESTFFVRALTSTPGIHFDSPPDIGYSVDNLAPGVPEAIMAAYQSDSVILDWDDASEIDFQYYRIYRGSDPGFTPSEDNLIHQTAASAWTDPTANPWGFHYKIATLDFSGNESEAASPSGVTGVQDGTVPTRTALLGAVPNPFNPMTKLTFELAAPGHARLKVYDTAGRLVATLVNERRDAGLNEVIWDGRDHAGRISSAGVYLYRLEVENYVETKRMTLIK